MNGPAPTFRVGYMAAAVCAAHDDWVETSRDPDPDKAWAARHSQASWEQALGLWMTLLGLQANQRAVALSLARHHAQAATIAHAAPF